MDHETLGGRIPKGERRVRFADSMGMELVSIFLTDLFVLASHTPYTNYNEHRKPPSSRLSSTLQAIQYNHDYHNKHTSSNSLSGFNERKAPTLDGAIKPSLVNNNNHYHGYNNNYHSNSSSSITSRHNLNATSSTINGYSSSSNFTYHPHHVSKATSKHQPSAPKAAAIKSSQNSSSLSQSLSPPSEFICEFTQPVSLISFKERVKLKKVHLENCYVNTTAGHVSLTCNIRVLNVSYDKSVSVRYTTDDWASHTDSLASYKPGSCDGWSDQFTTTISIINQLQPGQRIIFAVRFATGGNVYWDNNGGLNYSVKSKCDQK